MSRRIVFLLATTVPLLGCGPRAPQSEEPSPSFSSVITREELQKLNVRTLYDAVEQLRPRWLQVRSGMRSFSMETVVAVFQDDAYLGTQEVLQQMGVEGIYSIRYMDGPTAKASLPGLGSMHVQGAIIVSLRPPAPQDSR